MNTSQGLNPNRFLDYSMFNHLRKKLQPLFYIQRDTQLNPSLSPAQQALGFTIGFTQDNRPYFPARKNQAFMQTLKGLGFFGVFSTNNAGDDPNAFGVYLSQVSLFLEFGVQWVRSGVKIAHECTEIHHINSNVLDNRVDNLALVSCTVHSFLSTLQVGRDTVVRSFLSPSFVVLNNKGERLRGFQAVCKLGWLVHETLRRTKLWLKSVVLCLGTTLPTPSYSSFGFDIPEGLNTQDELYLHALDNRKEHKVLGMSWNWLLRVKALSLPTILSNLKCAASLFLRSLLGSDPLVGSQLLSTLSLV